MHREEQASKTKPSCHRSRCQILTEPKDRESKLCAALSPSTQQCPSGIVRTSEESGICTQSPGNAINLLAKVCLWLVGDLPINKRHN